MHRVERLEKLREKYKRHSTGMGRDSQDSRAEESQLRQDTSPCPPDVRERRVLEAVEQSSIIQDWACPSPAPPARRLVNASPLRSALGISSSEPAVGTLVERGASTMQRAPPLWMQSHSQAAEVPCTQAAAQSPSCDEQSLHPGRHHRSSLLSSSALAKASPSAPTKGGNARAIDTCVAANSTTPKGVGRIGSFVPSPRDTGVEAGNELARRLAASSSLPSLGHPRVGGGVLLQGRDGVAGYAQSGLTSLMGGGRDTGWR